MSALLVLSLSLFSMFATVAHAADAADKTQTERSARDFNHMITGFPLTGLHTTVECGSCHVGGVFRGTPRNCAGCHTKGMRVVATAKSLKHLVTTEPCEVCHTNTVTFFGARFNHGKAVVGQCKTCHNGQIAAGKAASHTTGNKATKSCDSCHRTYSWFPATWNHVGNTSACVTCHIVGGEGAGASGDFVKKAIAGTTPEAFAHNALNAALSCESCHRTYTSWYGAAYNHAGASSDCKSCHGSTIGAGISATPKSNTTVHQQTTDQCSVCHVSTATWAGALGAKPSYHIPENSGVTCGTCHIGTAKVAKATLHTYSNLTTCFACHIKPNAYTQNGQQTKSTHKGSSGNNCSSCHGRASSYTDWSE